MLSFQSSFTSTKIEIAVGVGILDQLSRRTFRIRRKKSLATSPCLLHVTLNVAQHLIAKR